MTSQERPMIDLGPKQLAWLRENVPAFKPAEKQASEARRHTEEAERKLKGQAAAPPRVSLELRGPRYRRRSNVVERYPENHRHLEDGDAT